jgi:hypothetical protein
MADVPGTRPIRLPRALTPLRHRNFRLLVIGQVTSNVGDACCAVAPPWYVPATHGGAVLLGTVLAANGFGNVLTITAFQRWAPPGTLGRPRPARLARLRCPRRPRSRGGSAGAVGRQGAAAGA